MVYVPKHAVEKFISTSSSQEIEIKITGLKKLIKAGQVNQRDGDYYLSLLEEGLAIKALFEKK